MAGSQATVVCLTGRAPPCHNQAVIVDFHTHVLPPRIRENRERYVQADPWFAELYSSPRATLASAEDLIIAMDEDGVAISAILNGAWESAELCAETNDYILESVSRHPRRLAGFCAVPTGERAAAEIERCVRGGASGIGEIRPRASPGSDNLAAMDAVLDGAREHGLPVIAHASEPLGHRYPGKGTATPGLLYGMLTRHPDATVVCAHWGGGLPFYAMMPEVKEALANVYFDTAASPFLYRPEVYAEVVRLVGADRVLLGSDYPLLRARRLIDEIRTADMLADVQRMLLGGNACRLLGVTAAEG